MQYQCANCDYIHPTFLTKSEISQTRCSNCGVYLHDAEPVSIYEAFLIKGFAGGVDYKDESNLSKLNEMVNFIAQEKPQFICLDGDNFRFQNDGHTHLVHKYAEHTQFNDDTTYIAFCLPENKHSFLESWKDIPIKWNIISPTTEEVSTWGQEPWAKLGFWGLEQMYKITPNIGVISAGGWTTVGAEYNMFQTDYSTVSWFPWDVVRYKTNNDVVEKQSIIHILPSKCFEFHLKSSM